MSSVRSKYFVPLEVWDTKKVKMYFRLVWLPKNKQFVMDQQIICTDNDDVDVWSYDQTLGCRTGRQWSCPYEKIAEYNENNQSKHELAKKEIKLTKQTKLTKRRNSHACTVSAVRAQDSRRRSKTEPIERETIQSYIIKYK